MQAPAVATDAAVATPVAVMIPTAREDVQTTVRTDRVPIAREMNATVEEMAAKM